MPLWLADKNDYSLISSGDIIETDGLAKVLEGDANAEVRLVVSKQNGDKVIIWTRHTLSADQIKWIRAGSALNLIREQRQAN